MARAASRRVVRKVQVRRSATISWDEVAARRVRKESPTEVEREMDGEKDGVKELGVG